MLRHSTVVALTSITLLTCFSASCGSSDSKGSGGAAGSGGGGPEKIADVRDQYATALCANIVPCCHGVGMDVTEQKCVAAVSAQFGAVDTAFGAFNVPKFPVSVSDTAIDAAGATSCIHAAAQAISACPLTFEAAAQASIDTLVACQGVYPGQAKEGAKCAHDTDCAPAKGKGAVSACLGKACTSEVYSVGESGDFCNALFAYCDLDNELTCDPTLKCTAGLPVGSFCCQMDGGGVDCNSDSELPCAPGSSCDSNIDDSTFGYCTAGSQPGDSCKGSAGCDAPQACVGGKCVAPKKGGDACVPNDACIGGSCQQGTCVSDFADSLWVQFCGGSKG